MNYINTSIPKQLFAYSGLMIFIYAMTHISFLFPIWSYFVGVITLVIVAYAIIGSAVLFLYFAGEISKAIEKRWPAN